MNETDEQLGSRFRIKVSVMPLECGERAERLNAIPAFHVIGALRKSQTGHDGATLGDKTGVSTSRRGLHAGLQGDTWRTRYGRDHVIICSATTDAFMQTMESQQELR